jgi:opacity protein-like surface antigen
MRRRTIIMIAVGLAMLAAPTHAQSPWSLSLAGGVSLPQGRFEDGASIGWHALASIGLSTLMQPMSLRLDAAHSRFTAKSVGPDQAVTSATLNLGYRIPMTNSAFSPYVITGAGAYRFECYGAISCGNTTRFGWNAGLGTKWIGLGFKGFLESRFHAVNAKTGNVRYIPVTFGLTF